MVFMVFILAQQSWVRLMGHIKYLGHAAFEIDLDGKIILVDPWISNPRSPLKSIDELKKVDYIVVTHDHGDHLGEAVDISKKFGAPIIATFELANDLSRKGAKTIGANIGGPIKAGDILFILVQATHSSTLGAPTGVIIRGKEKTIYHAGDTGIFSEMELFGEMYKINIALLPIGGHFTMGPYEAAWAIKMLKPDVVIPMHYQTFPVISGSPEELKSYLKEMKVDTQLVVLKPGEVYNF